LVRSLLVHDAMSQWRVNLGKTGEDLACRELERLGYAILDRRVRFRGGEIDIVARDGRTLVFVEVKARETGAFGGGGEAVTMYKRRRIVQLAIEYVARRRLGDCGVRFDVVSVQLDSEPPSIEVYKGAFSATD
jgi:putative endonuclease